jgi:hypothetical protein
LPMNDTEKIVIEDSIWYPTAESTRSKTESATLKLVKDEVMWGNHDAYHAACLTCKD